MKSPLAVWVGAGLALILFVVGGTLSSVTDGDVLEAVGLIVIGGPFVVVGALVASRQPANRIGWLMLGLGACMSVSAACDGAIQYGVGRPGTITSLGALGVVSHVSFSVFFALLFLLLALLPDGELASPRWRIVVVGVLVSIALDVVLVVRPGPLDDWRDEELINPIGVEALEPLASVVTIVSDVLTFGLLLASITSVVLRFRRSTGVERAQLRWIAAAGAMTLSAFVATVVGSALLGDRWIVDVLWGMSLLSIGLIPTGVGIAVMRYRLYEIDRVISRTLVYASVTVVLGAAYVGLVLAGQWLFSSFAGGSDLAVAASTLVVAALFLPIRSRVQQLVDRRFYRRRYDAQRTLEAFGGRLREQIELDALTGELRIAVEETMRPTHASLWLRGARP